LILFLVAATPLSILWFGRISGLPPELAEMARIGLLFALPLPALSVMQSWYQGMILFGRQTRGITESVGIYLLTSALILGAGVIIGGFTGLYIGLLGLVASVFTQTLWLWLRSQRVWGALQIRDSIIAALPTSQQSID